MARSLLKAREVPSVFWGEAVSTAVYILNRSSTRNVARVTPYEAWLGKKPNVHYFRIFWCVAHVKPVRPNAKKLDDRSKPMVMLRYEAGTKAYRVYDPIDERVHITRDVVLNEEAKWNWTEDKTIFCPIPGGNAGTFTFEYEVQHAPCNLGTPKNGSVLPDADNASTSKAPYTTSQSAPRVRIATPLDNFADMLDAADDPGLSHRFRTISNVYEADAATQPIKEELHFLATEEPSTFQEAEQHGCWRQAMLE